jgi:nucleotide-binding universal stress UspA family protein
MKVLIGVDGSPESERAAELAGSLLSSPGDEVTFYYSPPLRRLGDIDDSNKALLQTTRKALAEVVFARASRHLPEPMRIRVRTLVGTRKARKGILLAAAHYGPDMIAVGATGASQVAKMLLGSVSRAVVHGAGVPVLVARNPHRARGPLRVVFAFDRDGVSREAARFIEQLSWPADAQGYAIHIRESVFHGPIPTWLMQEIPHVQPEPLAEAWIAEEEREAAAAREELRALCQQIPRPFRDIEPAFLEGHAGEQIVKFVKTNDIDLVILGARVQSPVGRFLSGSTSEYVLAHAECSTLVVPHYETP